MSIKILVMSQSNRNNVDLESTFQAVHLGIINRIMAKKYILQIEKDREVTTSPRHSLSLAPQQTPRFLSGTSIPNSTIRSSLNSPHLTNINIFQHNVQPASSSHTSAKSSKKESGKISNGTRLSEERGLERMREKIRNSISKKESPLKNTARRRSSTLRAWNAIIPETKARRSTLESIKDAIDKSPNHIMKLVNADSIEKRNLRTKWKIQSLQLLNVSKEMSTVSEEKIVQKKDLETQTSLVLDKVLLEM